jgi:hypothetical protein
MSRLTLDLPIRDTTSPKAMEVVVTPMAIGTMVETRETTLMEATVTRMEEMEITMETMVSTSTTEKQRRISRISHASSARRRDTIPQVAQRTSLTNLPSPIHSRRDM